MTATKAVRPATALLRTLPAWQMELFDVSAADAWIAPVCAAF